MGPLFGAVFSLTGAFVYYALATYIFTRRDKSISHYLFIAMLLSLGGSETMAFFEVTGSAQRAYYLLRFDLSALALGAYFLFLFADYFREGFNKKFAIVTAVPTMLIIYMVFTVMIIDVEMGPYGWAGVYHAIYHVMFSIYSFTYVGISLYIFTSIYLAIDEPKIKSKIGIFILATSIVMGGGLLNAITLIIIGRVFPIMETSLMIFGIIATLAFRR